ncbi:MAG: hypothetical protein KDI71_07590 [Xanthomonadales bacterium]|nr:hypothetical protein [Xanthomonadales bacterium]
MTTSRVSKMGFTQQRGMVTLFVAIMLLLIISIAVLFSTSVGIFEIRTGANQYRSQRAFDAAQSGLNYGLEYVRANRARVASISIGGWLEENLEWWERCPADGVIVDDFPCDAESDPVRRSRTFRFRGEPGIPVADRYTLPIQQLSEMPQVDQDGDGTADATDPAIRYRVGGLLCLVVPDPTGVAPIDCEPLGAPGSAVERSVVESAQAYTMKLVSRGAIMSADAAALALPDTTDANGLPLAEAWSTLTQVFGSFRLLSGGPEAPLIAANSVTMRGTFDIVPNPNAAGFGVAISIWSASNIDPNGTPRSCYSQHFFNSDPGNVITVDGVRICDRCSCPREGSLSYKDGGTFTKGNDIIDATGNASVTGARNFPPDLFAYMFGIPKIDSGGNERWTEVPDRAVRLSDGACTGDPLVPGCCEDLGETSSGLFWSDEASCDLAGPIIGSPAAPVFVVAEKGCTARMDRYFGVLYKFSRPGDLNSYTLRVNGGGAIYGALVADDNSVVDKATGNFALVYDAKVMNSLTESPGFLGVGPLPGSWNDLGTF